MIELQASKNVSQDFAERVAWALALQWLTHAWHIYTTSVLQTSMYLWSSISAASCQGTFFPQQRSSTPLLLIKTTSMQRPICISLVDAFWSAGHLVACHLVAHGRIVTACKNIPATHNLVTKAKPPIHTLSASVLQLSETPTCHANKMRIRACGLQSAQQVAKEPSSFPNRSPLLFY